MLHDSLWHLTEMGSVLGLNHIFINPISLVNVPPLLIGQIHFDKKGCLAVMYNFIQTSKYIL